MPPDEPALGSNAPLEQNLGYVRMKELPDPPPELTVEEAADAMTANRKAAGQDEGKDPAADEGTGDQTKVAISAEQAADELNDKHKAAAEADDFFNDIQLATAVEEARARMAGEQSQEPLPDGLQQEGAERQAQEAPQEADGLTPKLRQALADPEISGFLMQEASLARRAIADAERATIEAGRMVQATIIAGIPELMNVPPEQTQGALAVIASHNPARYAQIMAQINQGKVVYERGVAIQRQNAEQEQQAKGQAAEQFQHWAKSEDDKFSAAFPEFADPEKAGSIRKGVVSYLTQTLGIPEKELPALWNQPWFRDSKAQRMMYDAYRHHEATERVAKMRRDHVPNVPQPMRPGSRSNNGGNPYRASDNSEQIAELRSVVKNSKGEKALRAAAKIMTLERAARAR